MKLIKPWLIGIVLVILLCIPFIIEWINPKYITAGDALAFWGAIIGATVAIAGIYLTFDHNQKMVSEERRLNVLPMIAINEIINVWQNSNQIDNNQGIVKLFNGKLFKDWWVNASHLENNFQFYKKNVKYEKYLNDTYKNGIGKSYKEYIEKKNLVSNIYIPFSFCNSGIGTAVNLKIEFELLNDGEFVFNKNDFMENLKVGESVVISFFCNDLDLLPSDTFKIKIIYNDIYTNEYEQIHIVSVPSSKQLLILDTAINQNLIKKSKQG